MISLICTLVFIPMKKPVGKRKEEQSRNTEQVAIQKVHITKGCIGWAVLMFVYFIACQAYSTNLSFILDEKGIGTSSASGVSLAVFAISGLIAGLVYSKVEQVGKNKVVSLAALIAIVQYFLLIMAQDLTIVYIGSFVGGFAVSFFMPQIFLYTGHSVDPFSVPMAVAIVTCAQNLGQFVCPYFINPVANAFAGTSGVGVNVMKYILCVVIFAVCGIIMLFYGIKKDRKTIS